MLQEFSQERVSERFRAWQRVRPAWLSLLRASLQPFCCCVEEEQGLDGAFQVKS